MPWNSLERIVLVLVKCPLSHTVSSDSESILKVVLLFFRNAKARPNAKHDFSHMLQYLERVNDVMAMFEERLWGHLDSFMELGQDNPTVLVDCLRIVELQVRGRQGGQAAGREVGGRGQGVVGSDGRGCPTPAPLPTPLQTSAGR